MYVLVPGRPARKEPFSFVQKCIYLLHPSMFSSPLSCCFPCWPSPLWAAAVAWSGDPEQGRVHSDPPVRPRLASPLSRFAMRARWPSWSRKFSAKLPGHWPWIKSVIKKDWSDQRVLHPFVPQNFGAREEELFEWSCAEFQPGWVKLTPLASRQGTVWTEP